MPSHFSALLVLPALPLLKEDLRQNSREQPLISFAENRRVSEALKLIMIALGMVLLLSLVTATFILTLSVAIVYLYLGWQVFCSFRILSDPLKWQKDVVLRLVAGENKQLSVKFENKTGKPLSVRIEGINRWVKLDRMEFVLEAKAQIDATVEPPLAGPSTLKLEVSIRDHLGLMQSGYIVDCAKLTVIPRATHSVYLAKKYLEHGAGAFRAADVSLASSSFSERKGSGVEYHSSHVYSPGDNARNIDWKHTARFRELVVKKYQNDYGNAAVILANLTTTSADEADKLSSSLVNSVLALAMSSVHAALVAYNEKDVVELTPMMPASALLKKVLGLIESIAFTLPSVRYLSPPDIRRLSRTRRELANVEMEPAKRMLDILDMEVEAVKMSTSRHPLSSALGKIASVVAPPAMMVPITLFNHDAEALNYILPRMEGRGYKVFSSSVGNPLARRTQMPPA